MAGNPYAAYKELVREELFGPQDGNPSVATDSRITTRRERAIGRSLRRGIVFIIACFVLYFIYVSYLLATKMSTLSKGTVSTTHATAGYNKVPLEAHIMSKCPDARDCLQQLVVPAMEKISDKVDFQLSFIARYLLSVKPMLNTWLM